MHTTGLNLNESIDILWGPQELQIPKHVSGILLSSLTSLKKKKYFIKTKEILKNKVKILKRIKKKGKKPLRCYLTLL